MPEEYDEENEKQQDKPVKVPPVRLTLTIHTMDRDRTSIELGEVTQDELKKVLSILDGTFEVLSKSNCLNLTDTRGKIYIFNKLNITRIEMDMK